MQDPAAYHRSKAEEAEKKLEQLRTRLHWTVFGRVLIFLGIVLDLYWTWGYAPWLPISSGLGLAGLFLFLVRLHAGWSERKELFEEKASLHRMDLERLQGQYPEWDEGVPEELSGPEADHPFAEDLDLFAPKGLMGWLDRSFSKAGRKRLIERLLYPSDDPEEIRGLQRGVAELAEKADERIEWRAHGRKARQLEKIAERGKALPPTLPLFLRIGVSVIMLALLTATIIGSIPFGVFLLSLVLPFALLGSFGSKVRQGFEQMRKEQGWIAGIRDILRGIERIEVQSELLQNEQDRLKSKNGETASEAMKKLDRILELYEARSNPFVGIVLNILVLWDLQCYELLRSWERDHGDELPLWVDTVAELDSLSSLASVAADHPSFHFPSFNAKGEQVLEGEALGHPLIPDEKRVDNDLEIPSTGHIKIVTGANMAGKSTFLRTIGVNWILAKAGTVVCAQRMRFRPISLFSSMRTSDDLAEEESFFYAELKRLRLLVDELEQGKELMILLDEILQGTNSEDKKKGSRRFLERILQYPVAGLIATHDLDLTRMEESHPGQVENLRFEAELEDGRSTFDHLLRKGVCRNMNASALMERMGIG